MKYWKAVVYSFAVGELGKRLIICGPNTSSFFILSFPFAHKISLFKHNIDNTSFIFLN